MKHDGEWNRDRDRDEIWAYRGRRGRGGEYDRNTIMAVVIALIVIILVALLGGK